MIIASSGLQPERVFKKSVFNIRHTHKTKEKRQEARAHTRTHTHTARRYTKSNNFDYTTLLYSDDDGSVFDAHLFVFRLPFTISYFIYFAWMCMQHQFVLNIKTKKNKNKNVEQQRGMDVDDNDDDDERNETKWKWYKMHTRSECLLIYYWRCATWFFFLACSIPCPTSLPRARAPSLSECCSCHSSTSSSFSSFNLFKLWYCAASSCY